MLDTTREQERKLTNKVSELRSKITDIKTAETITCVGMLLLGLGYSKLVYDEELIEYGNDIMQEMIELSNAISQQHENDDDIPQIRDTVSDYELNTQSVTLVEMLLMDIEAFQKSHGNIVKSTTLN